MLLLNRKRGEAIVIGNGITITVLETHGDRVKLGFIAPADVPIYRKESTICRRPPGPVFPPRR